MQFVNLKVTDELYVEWQESLSPDKFSKFGNNTFVLFRDLWNEYSSDIHQYHLVLIAPYMNSRTIEFSPSQQIYIGKVRVAGLNTMEERKQGRPRIAKISNRNIYTITYSESTYSIGVDEEYYEKLTELLSSNQIDDLLRRLGDMTTFTKEKLDEIKNSEVYSILMRGEDEEFQRTLMKLTETKHSVSPERNIQGTLEYIMNLPNKRNSRKINEILADHYEYRLFAKAYILNFSNYGRKGDKSVLYKIREMYQQDTGLVSLIDRILKSNFRIRELIYKIKDLLVKDSIDEIGEKLTLGHYTSLDTLQHIFKPRDKSGEKAFLRLTNSKQMNDPNEGVVLWKFLLGENGEEESYVLSNTYISCATTECDNLAMWNQYADNASGIMLEYDSRYLKKVLEQEDIRIGEVCYIQLQKDGKIKTQNDNISRLLEKLKTEIEKELGKAEDSIEKDKKLQEIRRLLGEISYLFKNMSYSYEKEYRILLDTQGKWGFERMIEPVFSTKGITLHIKLNAVELKYSRAILGPRSVDIDYIAPYLKLCNPRIIIQRSGIDFR